MYDIVFDFSSSPTGGALRRLEAYINFFSKSELKVIFLINKKAISILEKYKFVDFECINKSIFEKLFGKNKYLDKYKNKTNWLFSYGIPIVNPICKNKWFHISNALPIANFKVTLKLGLKIKMLILGFKITQASRNCNIVSAESKFSLNLYKRIDDQVPSIILENSFDPGIDFDDNSLPKILRSNSYGLIVGTASYKRLDIAYNLYLNIKSRHKLDVLVIIGDASSVNYFHIKNDENIVFLDHLTDNEYFSILKNSSIFISMSEIENSSCAVLEALHYHKTCYLSNIPSHLELSSEANVNSFNECEFICVTSDSAKKDFKSWDTVCRTMLKNMNFII